MESDVIIIGAGPAGLAAAMWLQKSQESPRVKVLESSWRTGGWVRSERRDGYLCEHGPQAVRGSAEIADCISMLGIDDELVQASPTSATRWLGRRGSLRPVPVKPLAMICSGLLSVRGKLRLLGEKRVSTRSPAAGGESVAAFCERRFGRESVPLIQAMLGGIYAGDARRLEAASALPTLTKLEADHGSVLRGLRAKRKANRARDERLLGDQVYSFRDGIEGLTNRLAAAVGSSLEVHAAVASVRHEGGVWIAEMQDGSQHRATRLVMACPARVSAALLAAAAPSLSAELAAIPYASLASVYLGIPMASLPAKLSGFGFLLESEADNPVLGAIYASQLFADHAPAGHQLLRVMMGGALHPEVVDYDDQTLIEEAIATTRRYLGGDLAPTFTHVVRAREAIPQFELGHQERMQRIIDMLDQYPGLRLCGNSYQSVALAAQLVRGSGLQARKELAVEEVAR